MIHYKTPTLLLALLVSAWVHAQVITTPGKNPTKPQPQTTNTNQAAGSSSGTSERTSEEKVVLNFNGMLGLPDGEFKDVSNNNWGYGIGGYLAYNPFHSSVDNSLIRPFIFGLNIEYLWFNNRSETFNGNDIAARTETRSRVKQGAFAIGPAGRVELFSKEVYLFAEYQVGLRFFSGKHNITFTRYPYSGNEPTVDEVSRTLEADVVGYYGGALGLGVNTGGLRIEFKLGYQRGGNATYIDPESITFQSANSITYKTKSSFTDMVMPQIGISTTF